MSTVDNAYQQTNVPKRKKGSKQVVLTLLYASLIVSSLIGVGFILFGNDNTYSGKAFSTIALIVLVDAFLMLALMSRIPALKYSSWGLTLISFVFSCLTIWLPSPQAEWKDVDPYKQVEQPRVLADVFGDIAYGLWALAVSVVLVAAFSILYKMIARINTLTKTLYWIMLGVAVVGTLPFSISISLDNDVFDNFTMEAKIYLSAIIICITIAVVLVIALINNAITNKNGTNLNAVQQRYLPYSQGNAYPYPAPQPPQAGYPQQAYQHNEANFVAYPQQGQNPNPQNTQPQPYPQQGQGHFYHQGQPYSGTQPYSNYPSQQMGNGGQYGQNYNPYGDHNQGDKGSPRQ